MDLKLLIGFCEEDVRRVREVQPLLESYVDVLSGELYGLLVSEGIFAGCCRDEILSRFGRWFEGLFDEGYGEQYLRSRLSLGATLARSGVPRNHVLAVQSMVRVRVLSVLSREDPKTVQSVLRLLDLDSIIIGLSYDYDRDFSSGGPS